MMNAFLRTTLPAETMRLAVALSHEMPIGEGYEEIDKWIDRWMDEWIDREREGERESKHILEPLQSVSSFLDIRL